MVKVKITKFFMMGALLFSILLCISCNNGKNDPGSGRDSIEVDSSGVVIGAAHLLSDRFAVLSGKRVAIVANATSKLPNGVHLIDTLIAKGVNLKKIFAPEHGFRGDMDAGKQFGNEVDEKTGLPVISLYGNNKKPTASQLEDIDVVIFDIQDVGCRFYTYISTLTYIMEACAENKKQLVITDRPNPNGWYVDGPLRDNEHKSFVGMHEVPIVHGMTIGEYAQMVSGEGWLGEKKCALTVIPCTGYIHKMRWEETKLPWVPPSPNLASDYAAYLYPILCWYEGMPVSVGRGTDNAFTMLGAPWHKGYKSEYLKDSALYKGVPGKMKLYGLESEYVKFTPRSIPGKAAHPIFENESCFGVKFLNRVEGKDLFLAGLSLLLNFEEESRNVKLTVPIFQSYFDQIAGNSILKEQIKKQLTPEEIYMTWKDDLEAFKGIRRKYLLYTDFL